MEKYLYEKLKLLTYAAYYDQTCSSVEKVNKYPIYYSNVAYNNQVRKVGLLKLLYTNICKYNCSYCINRRESNIPRAIFTPEEIAKITLEFYNKKLINGLFLSSAIYKSEEYTASKLLETIKLLREKYNFKGYIHVKIMPNISKELINEISKYASRVSINIEMPSEKSLKLFAPEKNKNSIIKPMKYIGELFYFFKTERKKYKKAPKILPSGHTTQMIIGASEEDDKQILTLSKYLYDKFHLHRVYFSAIRPIETSNPLINKIKKPPIEREVVLYQADFLIRRYNFSVSDFFKTTNNLPQNIDPKLWYALENIDLFPVEITKADYDTLIRVPGIGKKTAKTIIKLRKNSYIDLNILSQIYFPLKKAIYFITINGKYYGDFDFSNKEKIMEKFKLKIKNKYYPNYFKYNFKLKSQPLDEYLFTTEEI